MVYFLVGILILVILLWSIIKLPKKFKESMMLDIAFLIIIFFLVLVFTAWDALETKALFLLSFGLVVCFKNN